MYLATDGCTDVTFKMLPHVSSYILLTWQTFVRSPSTHKNAMLATVVLLSNRDNLWNFPTLTPCGLIEDDTDGYMVLQAEFCSEGVLLVTCHHTTGCFPDSKSLLQVRNVSTCACIHRCESSYLSSYDHLSDVKFCQNNSEVACLKSG
jgi:hypothetical protein